MATATSKIGSVFAVNSYLAVFFLLAGMISPQLHAGIEQQRQMFHDASAALERNQITRFNRLLKQLDDYPAAPYLEYDAFKRRVNQIKPQQAEIFLGRHADFPFAYHARG